MSDEKSTEDQFSNKDKENFEMNGLRQYGVYSAIVFQMLATMGLAFWGGKRINDHFEIERNLLTIAIGFLGMGIAFYNLLHQLKNIQNNENKK
ncbi:Putative F0F1-ATPase subunit Ca2+/Mg2+ transporter [Kaistella chaponensis]|uniref:Putative F0F1-ATPase subunit Ca2+/Mg2+ transporter n=1 Tax=Kaistella chaponensis TaxID=713588 RepID=A0A1N7MMR7_9FLAO|nr:AtpZ/AtpI family protein [Kaistella chaponensis]SIS87241.1 Putative F0F1-ATPase subunit Ca2+/Mg2+ transporter [Kaistella chaponensis]